MQYHLVMARTVAEARRGWRSARDLGKCLVLLPPVTADESKVLLAQLPDTPPAQAKLVVFTSGSDGTPKAVFHAEASLSSSSQQVRKWLAAETGVLVTLSPWSMAGFLFTTLLPEWEQLKIFTLSDSPVFAAGEVQPLVQAGIVSKIITHPFHLRMLHERGAFAELRGAPLGIASFTAPLPKTLAAEMQALGFSMEIGYGLSEAAGPVLVGGQSLGAQCELSSEGELLIRGRQMMLGYGSAGVFVPTGEPFHTGDYFSEETGQWQWRHRGRDLIDIAGRKVAPGLVEDVVMAYLQQGDCLAYAVHDEVYGQRVALLVEAEVDAPAFQRFLEQAFSPELRPKEWRQVHELPRLHSGKKDRAQLSRR